MDGYAGGRKHMEVLEKELQEIAITAGLRQFHAEDEVTCLHVS